MSYENRQKSGHRPQHYSPSLDTHVINLKEIDAELFSGVAHETAIVLADKDKRHATNKSTQLRRFYDEIIMWENRVSMHPDKFNEYLPFIRMLNAKSAYALGRKLVDKNYVKLLEHCLKQVETPETMRNFKLFMEAMMGFYKQERPKD